MVTALQVKADKDTGSCQCIENLVDPWHGVTILSSAVVETTNVATEAYGVAPHASVATFVVRYENSKEQDSSNQAAVSLRASLPVPWYW